MSNQQEIDELQQLLATCTNPAKENAIRRKIRELMEADKKQSKIASKSGTRDQKATL